MITIGELINASSLASSQPGVTLQLIQLTLASGASALGSVSNRARKFQTDPLPAVR